MCTVIDWNSRNSIFKHEDIISKGAGEIRDYDLIVQYDEYLFVFEMRLSHPCYRACLYPWLARKYAGNSPVDCFL